MAAQSFATFVTAALRSLSVQIVIDGLADEAGIAGTASMRAASTTNAALSTPHKRLLLLCMKCPSV